MEGLAITLPAGAPMLSRSLRRWGVMDFDEFDPSVTISSPRSLAACAAEGVRPKDLAYVPPEAFALPGVSAEVMRLRAGYFEAYRQDLIAIVRRAWADVAEVGDSAQMRPASVLPSSDPKAACVNTMEFFRQELRAIDLAAIPTRPDWSKCPRSPEFKRADHYAAFRAGSPKSNSGPMSMPAFLSKSASLPAALSATLPPTLSASGGSPARPESTGASDGGMGSMWWETKGSTWRSSTSQAALQDMLTQIREAPGSDWKEHDAARRLEDTFGSRRNLEFDAMCRRQKNEKDLLTKRMGSMEASFQNLHFDQQRRERFREIREYMMPPAASAGKSGGQARARANVVKDMEAGEAARKEHFLRRVEKQQALEHKIDAERFFTKIKFAQQTLEDRVRWRHNNAAVEDTRDEERRGIVEDFARKQGQLDAAGQKVADSSALRRELHNLRHTHRVLDEYRRRRKDEHTDMVKKAQVRRLAEERVEATGGRIALPTFGIARSPHIDARRSEPDASHSPAGAPPSFAATTGGVAIEAAGPHADFDEQLSPEDLSWMRCVQQKLPGARRPPSRVGGLSSTA